MTELKIKYESTVLNWPQGLTETIEPVSSLKIRNTYINIVAEQIIKFLSDRAAEQGFSNDVNISALYPEYPAGNDAEILAENIIPSIIVTVRLGSMREIGVGRVSRQSLNGTAYAFQQTVIIEFDCHGGEPNMADTLTGWVAEEIQKHKIDELQQKGFINFIQLGSRAAKGFDFAMPWDWDVRYFPLRMFRHLLYMETSFEVTWVPKPTAEGIITQILFEDTTEIDLNMVLGMTLEYLLAEELYLKWHNVFP